MPVFTGNMDSEIWHLAWHIFMTLLKHFLWQKSNGRIKYDAKNTTRVNLMGLLDSPHLSIGHCTGHECGAGWRHTGPLLAWCSIINKSSPHFIYYHDVPIVPGYAREPHYKRDGFTQTPHKSGCFGAVFRWFKEFNCPTLGNINVGYYGLGFQGFPWSQC